MKKVALADIKDQLSKYLREAESEEILITRHGKPAAVIIGFGSEDDWIDYKLENDERFLSRIEAARRSVGVNRGVPLEDLDHVRAAQTRGETARHGRKRVAAGRSTAGR